VAITLSRIDYLQVVDTCCGHCVDNVEWASETPKGLWKKIVDEVQAYFGYRLDWSVMFSVVLAFQS